ncbi:response regulator [Sulfurimonas sp. SAG-AH-194-I05]|nr:response regulator [Sulfurimonas sp. SAG-AH-194-I05]MDF1874476.1 response regulator [Sulfurimonas sp. SAG-AH-194-I05]
MTKKYKVLFITEEKSMLDSNSKVFNEVFITTDKASNEDEALALIDENTYDIVINDVSVDISNGTSFMKKIKEIQKKQEIVALASLNDEGKLAEMVDEGIHAFLITPKEFNHALEAIAQMELVLQK